MSRAKDVRGYAGKYTVYPDGRVWSVPRLIGKQTGNFNRNVGGKFLRQTETVSGTVVSFRAPHKVMMVHQVVAHAYVDGYFAGAMVGFKDNDRSNVNSDNLEWITRAESQRRASLRPKRVRIPPPPRRASGALDVWDTIPTDPAYAVSEPLPWET